MRLHRTRNVNADDAPPHANGAAERTAVADLVAAQAGDEHAFENLTLPLHRELHVYCYRMLGSLDDADDAMQATFLRAWRHIGGFQPRASLRAWLYRIATNVCLSMLAQRSRRGEVSDAVLDRDRGGAETVDGEPVHIQPYPDRLLDGLGPTASPEAIIAQRESIELAFVAAVQTLPPRQRAVLLLREVIGYSAAEVATMLGTSVAGVNSAMQRARATLAKERTADRLSRAHAPADSAAEQKLVRNLIAAWHSADVASIVSLLTEDALLTMPPLPHRYVGRRAIGEFLATGPAGGRLDRFRLVPAHANRQPAVAAYLRDDESGPYLPHAVMILAIGGSGIASLTRFAGGTLFAHFGLPQTVVE